MSEHVTHLELHHDGTFDECCENAIDAAVLLTQHGFAVGVRATLPSTAGEPQCSPVYDEDD